jgi:hypothetical protein
MWLVLFFVILLVLVYFLFAPIIIEIDTDHAMYRLRFHRLASARLFMSDSLMLRLEIGRWMKQFDLLRRKEKKITPQRIQNTSGKHFHFRKIVKKISAILQSFRLTKCIIRIDTGDFPLNGILYPWFFLLSQKTGKLVMINFENDNRIVLEIRNSVARMLWAYIKS